MNVETLILVLIVLSVQSRVVDKEESTSSFNNLVKDVKGQKAPENLLKSLNVLPEIDNGNLFSQNENTNKKKIHFKTTTITPPTLASKAEVDNNELDNNIQPYNNAKKADNGTILLITPYIEQGRLKAARNKSAVSPELFLGFESYSGYLTVNKTYNSNLFFWFFPSPKKQISETPWIIWLQGGPGSSSLIGLFEEIGPFHVGHDGALKRSPFSWLQNHSLLFIDNPVGTGYSFTEHPDGYATDMTTYSTHLYTALKQFLQIFPELRVAPLFIAGESYAGKYVPALAMEIHNHKDVPGADINLQGLIIGNGYVDPSMLINVAKPFYNFGLIQQEQMELLKPLIDSFASDIANNRSSKAKEKWNNLIGLLVYLSHQKHAYNFLRDEISVGMYSSFISKPIIKRAIHVGNIEYSFLNITVNSRLEPEFLTSTKPLMETLLNDYRVLAYCGQLDQMLACAYTSENYRTWQWEHSEEFIKALRYPYIFKGRLAGYQKSGGHLTEVIIRGAGHMVPLDMPQPTQNLVARWTHNQPIVTGVDMWNSSLITAYVRNVSSLVYL